MKLLSSTNVPAATIAFILCGVSPGNADTYLRKNVDIVFFLGDVYSKIRIYYASDGRLLIQVGKACGVVIPRDTLEATIEKSPCKFGQTLNASYTLNGLESKITYRQYRNISSPSFEMNASISLDESGQTCRINDLKVLMNGRPAPELRVGSCEVRLGLPRS
jgi:hypothetical protein